MPNNDLQNKINAQNRPLTPAEKRTTDLSKTSATPTANKTAPSKTTTPRSAANLRHEHREDQHTAANRVRQTQVQQQATVTQQGQQGLIARMRSAISGATTSQARAGQLVQEDASKSASTVTASAGVTEKVEIRMVQPTSRVEQPVRRKEASAANITGLNLQQGQATNQVSADEQLEAEAMLSNDVAPALKDKEAVRKALRIVQMPVSMSTRQKQALQFFPIVDKAHQFWNGIARKGGPVSITRAKVQRLARWAKGGNVDDGSDSFSE